MTGIDFKINLNVVTKVGKPDLTTDLEEEIQERLETALNNFCQIIENLNFNVNYRLKTEKF